MCTVPQTLEVGDYVRGDWAGRGVLYPGEVLTINREDGTVDILYDDGDFESHVPRERLHAVSIELTDTFHSFSVGDVVKVDLRGHGAWYTGRVIAVDTKFCVFTVKYLNGHLEKHVSHLLPPVGPMLVARHPFVGTWRSYLLSMWRCRCRLRVCFRSARCI